MKTIMLSVVASVVAFNLLFPHAGYVVRVAREVAKTLGM